MCKETEGVPKDFPFLLTSVTLCMCASVYVHVCICVSHGVKTEQLP